MASIAGAHVADESILLSDLSFRGVRRAVMSQTLGTRCERGSPRHGATANPGNAHGTGIAGIAQRSTPLASRGGSRAQSRGC